MFKGDCLLYLVKMSRLHFITPWQGKKTAFLSEERLFAQKREETFRLRSTGCAVTSADSFRHFFGKKKWRLEIFIFPRHSERIFEAETSEFRCEIKF